MYLINQKDTNVFLPVLKIITTGAVSKSFILYNPIPVNNSPLPHALKAAKDAPYIKTNGIIKISNSKYL